MRTIKIKEFDGHKAIVGFGRVTIDPVATRKNLNNILKDLDEDKKHRQAAKKYIISLTKENNLKNKEESKRLLVTVETLKRYIIGGEVCICG